MYGRFRTGVRTAGTEGGYTAGRTLCAEYSLRREEERTLCAEYSLRREEETPLCAEYPSLHTVVISLHTVVTSLHTVVHPWVNSGTPVGQQWYTRGSRR